MLNQQQINNAKSGSNYQYLESLLKASEIVLSKNKLDDILQIISDQACGSLGASWANIVLLQDGRLVETNQAGKQGVLSSLPYIRQDGHSNFAIKNNVVVSIENVNRYDSSAYGGIEINEYTIKQGIKSVYGIPISSQNKAVGVVWLHFNVLRVLSYEEMQQFRTFVNQAALAYNKIQQDQRIKSIEKIVSLMTLDDNSEKLELLAYEVKNATNCDIISLYTYNPDAGRLNYPPIFSPLKFPEEAQRDNRVSPESIVYKMLDRIEPYAVEDVEEDGLFKDRPFTRREGIKSVVACPLRIGDNKLGVLFANYRNFKAFDEDELRYIKDFVKYLSIATQNLQNFTHQRRRVKALKSIYSTGNLTTGINMRSVNDVLMEIAKQAVSIVGFEPAEIELYRCFSHVAVIEGSRLIFKAACPYEKTMESLGTYGELGLELDTKTIYLSSKRRTIAGRAVLKKETLNIGNVENNHDYVPISHKTKSQLSVPIIMHNTVLGVISIEHPAQDAFDSEDVENVQALAAWAAAVIQQAKLDSFIQRVNETSILGKSEDSFNSLLEGIKQISRCDLLEIHLYDELNSRYTNLPIRTEGISDNSKKITRDLEGEFIKGFIESDEQFEIQLDIDKSKRFFQNDEFFVVENIKASHVIKLAVMNKRQGLLFLDYYSKHDFAFDEIKTTKLFVNHAAVALHNISLLEQERRTKLLYDSFKDISVAAVSNYLPEVANTILKELRKFVNYDKATMQLISKDGTREIIASSFDKHLINQKLLRPIYQDNLISKIIDSQEIYIISDTSTEKYWDNNIEETKDVFSWIGIPLVFRNEVLGLITLDSKKEHSFTFALKKMLTLLSNQAAYAIGTANLLSEINTYADTMKIIHQMGMDIAESAIEELNPAFLFDKIYQYFQKLFPKINNFHIAEYSQGDDLISFPLAIENGFILSGKGEWTKREPTRGLTEYVIKSSKPLLLPTSDSAESVLEWQIHHNIEQKEPAPSAWVGVPLIVRKHTIGAIAAYHYEDYTLFDDRILEILDVFGSHVAIALEYANTRTLFRDLIRFLTNLYKLDDEEEIILEVLIKIVEVLDSELAGICLLNGDDLLVKDVFDNNLGKLFNPRGTRIAKNNSIAWMAVENKSLVYLNYEQKNSREKEFVFYEFAKSSVAAPIFRDDIVIGVLIVESVNFHYFEQNNKWTMAIMRLFTDITSLSLQMAHYIQHERRTRDSLAIADSAIVGGALAKSVLHELNNGISTVDNLLFEVIEDITSLQGVKRQNQLLELLASARQHLKEISVDPQVLAFTGRLRPNYALKSLNEIVENSTKFMEGMLKRQNISYQLDLDLSLNFNREVNVDENQIRQVIINLVLNAVDAYHGQKARRTETPGGSSHRKPIGKIIFRTRAMRVGAQFELEDFATGISEEVENNLFEPFVTSKSEGSGLGLYISKEIIHENHKGELYYRSKGKGTIFIFRIPYTSHSNTIPQV